MYLVTYTSQLFWCIEDLSRQIFWTFPPKSLLPWYFMYSFKTVLLWVQTVELCTQFCGEVLDVWCFHSCTPLHATTTTQTTKEVFRCHVILSVALNSDVLIFPKASGCDSQFACHWCADYALSCWCAILFSSSSFHRKCIVNFFKGFVNINQLFTLYFNIKHSKMIVFVVPYDSESQCIYKNELIINP